MMRSESHCSILFHVLRDNKNVGGEKWEEEIKVEKVQWLIHLDDSELIKNFKLSHC